MIGSVFVLRWFDRDVEVEDGAALACCPRRKELCGEIHNRMPVILPPDVWPTWLGEGPAEPDVLKSLLVPYAGAMVAWPVSQRVGNVKNNDASLIEAIE
jgi:putative SOS response-associated peptidase YedK